MQLASLFCIRAEEEQTQSVRQLFALVSEHPSTSYSWFLWHSSTDIGLCYKIFIINTLLISSQLSLSTPSPALHQPVTGLMSSRLPPSPP